MGRESLGKIYKVIVAGSRTFDDYYLLRSKLNWYLIYLTENKDNEVIIVSGTAKGADSLGEQYAEEYQLKVERYPADWDTYGNKAGYLRNAEMAEVADYCVLFWDGVSKGTKLMKELAEQKGIPTKVVYYET